MSSLPVLLIGAGPASLTLAHGLKKLHLPFFIFERDETVTARPQGYRFRLEPAGADALEEAVTPEVWTLFERSCASMVAGITLLDPLTGNVGEQPERLPQMARVSGHRTYTVDRTTLRYVLLHGLDKEALCFGKEFASYELAEDHLIANFTDGSSIKGSMIVGADGGNSRVRKQYIPELKPLDAEGRFIFGKTPLTTDLRNIFDPKAMTTMNIVRDRTQDPNILLLLEAVTFDHDKPCAVPLPDDYIYWVLVTHRDAFAQRGISDQDFSLMTGEEAKKKTLALTEKWSPNVRSVIQLQAAAQTSTISVRTMKPDLPSWTSPARGRVTLIGDAMHIMPPTGAVGASCAIQDAASLFRQISKTGLCPESMLSYEAEMKERVREPMRRSLTGAKMMFGLNKDVEELKVAPS